MNPHVEHQVHWIPITTGIRNYPCNHHGPNSTESSNIAYTAPCPKYYNPSVLPTTKVSKSDLPHYLIFETSSKAKTPSWQTAHNDFSLKEACLSYVVMKVIET